ncbi:3-oxoacyl-ACP synthase [Rossellomorea marisflavi]|jgi:3-oxoacyl-[acyl-carrier-protein] synthase II|uniref:3-oxoacyl-[acyl-carrier-protein] synthase 2 n=1 Tax=Rossellomorea marisflavi TaxID=189381 RepID=A0A0M0G4W3_9BACI|nr:beta-ketoacyl-ACP synthase II [Rossellomorea marisflavi]KON84890.1 3-oxoacyl-ACP synthase [Rossellomorea marisflavi]
MKKRVVVTGMGIISPSGLTIQTFWENISNGLSGIDYIKSFDTTDHQTRIGGEVKGFNPDDHFSSKEQSRMDTFTQYAMAAARQAINQASLSLRELDPFRVGVLVGSGMGGTKMILENYQKIMLKGPRRISPYLASGMLINAPANEISLLLGARGKSGAFVTACAASANAIGEAMRSIQYGEADIIVAGGAEGAVTPLDLASFSRIKALSTHNEEPQRASRPFDKQRDGFVIAAGGGMVVLESLDSALERGVPILAELTGYGATTDAYHITAPDPEARGARRAIMNALADAELRPSAIDYINAHGTSTKLNDYTETIAIKQVFGPESVDVPVSSIKSMTGHMLGGAGAAELISSVLTIQNELIPPTINYEEADEGMDLNYVPHKAQKRKVEHVLSNSFGFGGHNACLVIKKWRQRGE